MIQFAGLDPFLQFHPAVPEDLKNQEGHLPTLAVQWDQAPELVWTLRLTEMMGNRTQKWGYQPHTLWQADGAGSLSYIDCPIAGQGEAQGRCSCKAWAADDALFL